MKRCVIYARFSSAGQREESIEGQIRECTAYAERNDMVVVDTYEDRARSATTDSRPSFQRMIADSSKDKFDVVLCWKHDRFARNRFDAAVYKAKLKKNNVTIQYAMEYIPEGPDGIILESVMEAYAEYYSANLSQNVKRGLYDAALKRKTLGQTCYGLRKAEDGTFEHHPEQAQVVSRIFVEYASGIPAIDIITKLNEEGYRTRTGGLFNKSSVAKIVRNEKYKGMYRYADIVIPDGIPPIVSPELWHNANERMDREIDARGIKGGKQGYILSGKLYCGHCGKTMQGMTGRSSCGERKQYRYYRCGGRLAHECSKEHVPCDWIENVVITALMDIVLSDEMISIIAKHFIKWQDKQDVPLRNIEKDIGEEKRKIGNLVKVIAETGTPYLTDEVQAHELRLKELENQLAIEKAERPRFTENEIKSFLTDFRYGDTNNDKFVYYLIQTFCNAVYVYDDGRVTIHLNYTGEHNKVSFDTIEKLESEGEIVYEKSDGEVVAEQTLSRQCCHTRTIVVCIDTNMFLCVR